MAQFTNPLFAPQIGERSTSGGAEQSSASGESLSAAYRPSPVPLRSIGDVVSSLGKVRASLQLFCKIDRWIRRLLSITVSLDYRAESAE